MVIVVVLFLLACTMPMASGYFQTVSTAESLSTTKQAAIAENFVIYRYAALNFMELNPSFTGVIPDTSLVLPPNYVKLGSWTNLIQGGFIVIYSANQVAVLSSNVLAKSSSVDTVLDYTANGRVVSPVFGDRGASFNFVPDGSLISVIQQY